MFRSRGGGVSDFTTIEGRSQTSVFFRSPLDQKEAIGVVFRSMDPPQAILEPHRVRVTLIPGSTLKSQVILSTYQPARKVATVYPKCKKKPAEGYQSAITCHLAPKWRLSRSFRESDLFFLHSLSLPLQASPECSGGNVYSHTLPAQLCKQKSFVTVMNLKESILRIASEQGVASHLNRE